MRKTKLMVTHPEATDETLGEYVCGRGPVRMGLRIAVLQGVMDRAPIDQLNWPGTGCLVRAFMIS